MPIDDICQIPFQNNSPDTATAQQYFEKAHGLYDSAKYSTSIIYFEKAAAIFKGHGTWGQYIDSKNLAGAAFSRMGAHDTAMAIFEITLQSGIEKFGDISEYVAESYNHIGDIYMSLGAYDLSLKFHNNALRILKSLQKIDPYNLASTYKYIGYTHYMLADHSNARMNYNKGFDIIKNEFGEDHLYAAPFYNNFAIIADRKTQADLILQYHQKALDIWIKNCGEIHPDVARSYRNMGVQLWYSNEKDEALLLLQKALEIYIELYGSRHDEVAHSYQILYDYYYHHKEYTEALKYSKLGLLANVKNSEVDEINIHDLNNLMMITESEYYDPILLMYHLAGIAHCLEKMYYQTHKIKSLQAALNIWLVHNAITEKIIVDRQTGQDKIILTHKLVGSYLRSIHVSYMLYEYYVLQLDLARADEFARQAFRFSEKAKSVVLLEALNDSRAKIYAGIPDSLLIREKNLKINITDYINRINNEMLKKELADSLRIRHYENTLFTLNSKHRDLLNHFKEKYPAYDQLKYQVTNSLVEQIMTRLQSNEALIEYFIADSNLFIFTISDNSFNIDKISIFGEFSSLIYTYLNSIKKVNTEVFTELSNNLFNILIRPVSHHLKNKNRLIIIPDGLLNYLPFETLITEKPIHTVIKDFSSLNYLLGDYFISYHFSSTLWLNMLNNKNRQQSGDEFIGFAPVFHSDSTNGHIPESNKPFVDSTEAGTNMRSITINGKQFNALPFSEMEVDSIVKMCRNKGQKAQAYFHAEATEDNFKNNCRNYRVVHVASHAFYNKKKPALSGVVFSQTNDSHQHPDSTQHDAAGYGPEDNSQPNDGILYNGEAFNLELNADLLVLSACESGIGEYLWGEGVMSMTRGFLYSGAKNIIISLWKIDDKDTKDLMVEMYRHYFSGKSIPSSLRNAKLKLIKNPETSFPKYWSGFVLVGE